jgi:hypothetical protein
MLDQIVGQIFGGKKNDMASMLTGALGVNQSQAGGFLDKLLPMVLGGLKQGKFDVASLLGGNTTGLKNSLDLNSLGKLLGGGAPQASKAVDTVAKPIAQQLQGVGDLNGLLGQLGDVSKLLDDGKPGGIDDAVRKAGGGILGKIFGG